MSCFYIVLPYRYFKVYGGGLPTVQVYIRKTGDMKAILFLGTSIPYFWEHPFRRWLHTQF